MKPSDNTRIPPHNLVALISDHTLTNCGRKFISGYWGAERDLELKKLCCWIIERQDALAAMPYNNIE